MRAIGPLPVLVLAALLPAGALAAEVVSPSEGAAEHLAAGDAAWAGRAEGAPAGEPGWAAPGPIGRAVEEYEAAVAQAPVERPDDLEARRKLLRALWFQGEHVARGSEARQEVFGRGRQASEAALERLAARVGGREALEELAPEEPLNLLYLAEAILEHAPERRADALAELRALLRRTPDPNREVEEAAARRAAREILAREGGG